MNKRLLALWMWVAGAGAWASPALAGGFVDVRTQSLRADIEALVDIQLINIPVSAWPIPSDDLASALKALDDRDDLSLAEIAIISRVRRALDPLPPDGVWTLSAAVHPTLFRRFEDTPREEGGIGHAVTGDWGRVFTRLEISAVASPADHQVLRLDGSYVGVNWGNWLFSAGVIPRWWSPSSDTSIILSTNARAVPGVSFDRVRSKPFETRWLHWLGPWRLSGFVGQLEHDRQDIQSPLFAGMRFAFKPLRDLEIGFSRTTQTCGKGRPCGFSNWKHLLLGQSNVGIAGLTSSTDPGNDMAGYDMRWVSPLFNWSYAIYGQMIGEDEISYGPVKDLGQFGLEYWHELDHGGLVRVNAEYANTACAFTRQQPLLGCAYTQTLYNHEGYRFRGRIIGASWEADAEVLSLNASYAAANGDWWAVNAHHGRLNRGDIANPFNIVAPNKRSLDGIDVQYRFERDFGTINLGLGVDRLKDLSGARRSTTHAFANWQHAVP
jgi:Capsule assembly protein Wzi